MSMNEELVSTLIFGRTVETDSNIVWCIYDVGDDAIIVEGTFIEMEDLIDTMAGNLIIIPVKDLETFRKNAP